MTSVVNLSQSYHQHLKALLTAAEEALSASGFDALLIHSGTPLTYFSDDQEAPFHSNPYFAHFVPLSGPHHLLFIQPGKKPLLVRVKPEDFWREHAPLENQFWISAFDFREAANSEAAWKEIPLGARIAYAYIGDNQKEAEAHGIAAVSVNPPAILSRLDWRRSFKTPYEVSCIEEANRVSACGHSAARGAFLSGVSEIEIHYAYLSALDATEVEFPYETVVALDEKAAILHYQGKRKKGAGSVLLLDAGASHLGYASDITRTYLTTTADSLFRDLYEGVEKIQKELCEMAKPGVSFPDLHRTAHVKIGDLLHSLGIIAITGKKAESLGITKAFFPHGLGHFLGITVHDVGGNQKSPDGGALESPKGYPRLRMTRTIEERMVFTIEPGIYFIEMLLRPHRSGDTSKYFDWKLIGRLMPFGGIRIEDDILATKEGNRNLTRPYV